MFFPKYSTTAQSLDLAAQYGMSYSDALKTRLYS